MLAFLFAFVSPVVLIEGLGGRAALRRSIDLVRVRLAAGGAGGRDVRRHSRGRRARIAGALIPHAAIFLDSLFSDLITLVLLPDPVIGAVLLYFDIRRKRENFTNDRLRADLAALQG